MQTSERLTVVAIFMSLVAVLVELFTFAANLPRPFYICLAIMMLATATAYIVVAVLETVRKMDGTSRPVAFWILGLAWLAYGVAMFAQAPSA